MYIHIHLDQANLMSGAVDSEMYDVKRFVSLLIMYLITLYFGCLLGDILK